MHGRQNLIRPEHKEEIHKYITGIVTRQGQKLLAIHALPDHVRILIGLKPGMDAARARQLVGAMPPRWGFKSYGMVAGYTRVAPTALAGLQVARACGAGGSSVGATCL